MAIVFNAFQHYLRYIVAINFIGGETLNARRKSLSHNVVSNIPRRSGIRTHNFNGDRH